MVDYANDLLKVDQTSGNLNPNDDRSRNVVHFFKLEVTSEFRTNDDGTPFKTQVDAIEIRVPGDKDNIVTRQATETDKATYPQQWENYQNAITDQVLVGPQGQNVGTPLEDMGVDERTIYLLKASSIFTVEQLANLSDRQVQAVGMGAATMRMNALRFLASAKEAKSRELEAKLDAVLAYIAEQNAKPEDPASTDPATTKKK